MKFERALALMFGGLLLLYAGGCSLFGAYLLGDEMRRTGSFPIRGFGPMVMMIGFATITVSGLFGWLIFGWGARKLTQRSVRLAGAIAGLILLAYAGIFVLFGIEFQTGSASDQSKGEWMYIFGGWVLGLGVPGLLLLWWGLGARK